MKTIIGKIYKGTSSRLIEDSFLKIKNGDSVAIVTVNSEHLQKSNKCLGAFYLSDNTFLVADGVGIKVLTNLKSKNKVNKITGVSISEKLLEKANEDELSVAILGASKISLNFFEQFVKQKYPNIQKLKLIDGFVENKKEHLKEVAEKSYDIVLVALGVPAQEILIKNCFKYFEKSILVGVGGSIDVLGGFKKRAPNFFLKTNTEWLYRILSEPFRIKRFVESNAELVYRSIKNEEIFSK